MDQNWDSDKLKAIDLPGKVISIYLAAFINSSNQGDGDLPPTNHWAVYLVLPTRGSVRIDMLPGWGSDGLRGKLEVSSKPYDCTNKWVHRLTFRVLGTVTVQQIIDLIQNGGRQKYQFTEDWEGCRYWNYVFIQDLEKAGIISPGSTDEAWASLTNYWIDPRGSGKQLRDVGKGSFRI